MSLIYLAFANDKNDPLPTLREEESVITDYLVQRAQQGYFDVRTAPFATTKKIIKYLNIFKEDISVN